MCFNYYIDLLLYCFEIKSRGIFNFTEIIKKMNYKSSWYRKFSKKKKKPE